MYYFRAKAWPNKAFLLRRSLAIASYLKINHLEVLEYILRRITLFVEKHKCKITNFFSFYILYIS